VASPGAFGSEPSDLRYSRRPAALAIADQPQSQPLTDGSYNR